VMGASLQDRIDIFKGISRHSSGDYDETSWKNLLKDYAFLQQKSSGARDFAWKGRVYVDFLDAMGNNEWSEENHKVLDLIETRFKAHPDQVKTFTDILALNMGLDKSVEILDLFCAKTGGGTIEERGAVFGDMLKECQDRRGCYVDEAITSFDALQNNPGDRETLTATRSRLGAIYKSLEALYGEGQRSPLSIHKEARDAFLWIADEKKKGTFRDTKVQDVTVMLLEELIMSKKLDDAKRAVIFKLDKANESHEVTQDDDVVNIGGVKLDIKKHK
jgi:hypothetical protein